MTDIFVTCRWCHTHCTANICWWQLRFWLSVGNRGKERNTEGHVTDNTISLLVQWAGVSVRSATASGDKSPKTLSARCACLCWVSHWINKNQQTYCRVLSMTVDIDIKLTSSVPSTKERSSSFIRTNIEFVGQSYKNNIFFVNTKLIFVIYVSNSFVHVSVSVTSIQIC